MGESAGIPEVAETERNDKQETVFVVVAQGVEFPEFATPSLVRLDGVDHAYRGRTHSLYLSRRCGFVFGRSLADGEVGPLPGGVPVCFDQLRPNGRGCCGVGKPLRRQSTRSRWAAETGHGHEETRSPVFGSSSPNRAYGSVSRKARIRLSRSRTWHLARSIFARMPDSLLKADVDMMGGSASRWFPNLRRLPSHSLGALALRHLPLRRVEQHGAAPTRPSPPARRQSLLESGLSARWSREFVDPCPCGAGRFSVVLPCGYCSKIFPPPSTTKLVM